MAGFEGTRIAPLGEAIREWRPGRFVPLYVAGILAGVGIGVAVATWPTGEVAVQDHVAIAPAPAPIVDDVAFSVTPAGPVTGINPSAETVMLPLEFYQAMGALPAAPEPAAPEPVTAPESAPVAAPIVPAAPAKPAPQPVAQAPATDPAPAAPVAPAAAPPAKPNFYVPAVSSGPANALELDLLNFINAERANAGLAPYVLDAGLTRVARTRSQQLIDQNYFAHRDPYGYSMYVELLAYFGYTSYAWAGENLAMNNWPAEGAAAEAIRGLMNSPTHRANILAGDFFRIGIGEVTDSTGRHFFTMIFLG